MSEIRDALKARGLEGSDLESLIDGFLRVHAYSLASLSRRSNQEDRDRWLLGLYGHDTIRLASALIAISDERDSRA